MRLLYNEGRKGCQGDFDTSFRPLSPNSLPRRGERANPGLYSDFGSWIPAFAGMTRWELLAMEAHYIIRLRSGWQTSPSLYIFASMWFYRSKVHSTLSRQGSTFGPDCDSAGTNINDQSFHLVGESQIEGDLIHSSHWKWDSVRHCDVGLPRPCLGRGIRSRNGSENGANEGWITDQVGTLRLRS